MHRRGIEKLQYLFENLFSKAVERDKMALPIILFAEIDYDLIKCFSVLFKHFATKKFAKDLFCSKQYKEITKYFSLPNRLEITCNVTISDGPLNEACISLLRNAASFL